MPHSTHSGWVEINIIGGNSVDPSNVSPIFRDAGESHSNGVLGICNRQKWSVSLVVSREQVIRWSGKTEFCLMRRYIAARPHETLLSKSARDTTASESPKLHDKVPLIFREENGEHLVRRRGIDDLCDATNCCLRD